MALRFYNTLTQEMEEFHPLHDKTVRMYTCGPTVYNFAHIGNFRTFTFEDILRRWLRYSGYTLDHVMNVTDVEDKIIANAAKEGKSLEQYTSVYKKAFFEDAAMLRLEMPEHVVPATEHIPVMVQAIERLGECGCTYASDGSIYFRIATFPEYGKLSHNDFSGILSGARVDVDEYDKADARDFVLWKARKNSEPFWESPFGPGRPGWHIECSAMALEYLGETLDIHAGGVDLMFPHHENEIAQSESMTGRQFARYWLHAEHLHIESQKMSKSLGNFYTLRDLLDMNYAPESIRYVLASVPYRKKLNFTFDGLAMATKSIERLRDFQLRLQFARLRDDHSDQISERSRTAIQKFEEGMNDDLNTAAALAAIFEYVRDMNTALDEYSYGRENRPESEQVLRIFDSIFDVLRPSSGASAPEQGLSEDEIMARIEERNAAKKKRDFARSDAIRAELFEKGIVLEDTPDGVRWKRR